ncbi:hypothetical protein PLUTE_b0961 [Pseudoalteromonas luteoviolacea DSM 6061]|nr:hypothetical protein [Pseudoalteromonas luteoviolacea DSM 6061]
MVLQFIQSAFAAFERLFVCFVGEQIRVVDNSTKGYDNELFASSIRWGYQNW